MSTVTAQVKLSQEEMEVALNNFIIESYIANGKIKVTPSNVEKNLGFTITKEILSDNEMSVRCALIDIEIQEQCELMDQKDFVKYYNKVSKKIRTFDFSKYEDMSIEELRSYLIVQVEKTGAVIRGENLIEKKTERACVGIYALLKGGSYIKNE